MNYSWVSVPVKMTRYWKSSARLSSRCQIYCCLCNSILGKSGYKGNMNKNWFQNYYLSLTPCSFPGARRVLHSLVLFKINLECLSNHFSAVMTLPAIIILRWISKIINQSAIMTALQVVDFFSNMFFFSVLIVISKVTYQRVKKNTTIKNAGNALFWVMYKST